jgi:hypothetical protein
MKKIRSEGLFEGKNKIHFDEEMNPITDEEHLRRQYLNSNKQNAQISRNFETKINQNRALDEEAEKRRRRVKRTKNKDQIKMIKGEILPQKSRFRHAERPDVS